MIKEFWHMYTYLPWKDSCKNNSKDEFLLIIKTDLFVITHKHMIIFHL